MHCSLISVTEVYHCLNYIYLSGPMIEGMCTFFVVKSKNASLKQEISRIFNAEVVFERSITNANLILMAGDTASGQSSMNYYGYLS